MSSFIVPIQHCTGSSNQCIRARKRSKRQSYWKGRNKFSLFADNMIVYIENPMKCTKIFLDLLNKLSKVAEFKVNIPPSVVFLYTNYKQLDIEILNIL